MHGKVNLSSANDLPSKELYKPFAVDLQSKEIYKLFAVDLPSKEI